MKRNCWKIWWFIKEKIWYGASHQHTDYEGNEILNEPIINKKATHNQINNIVDKDPINFQNNNIVDAEPLTPKSFVESLNEEEDEKLDEASKIKIHNKKKQINYDKYKVLFNQLYPTGKDDKGGNMKQIDFYDDREMNKRNNLWSTAIRTLKNKLLKIPPIKKIKKPIKKIKIRDN